MFGPPSCLPSWHLPLVSVLRFVWRPMTSGPGQAEAVFRAALSAVQPKQLVNDHLKIEGQTLLVGSSSYALNHNVHIVGFGKAALGFVNHVGNLVKNHIVDGIVSCPDLHPPPDGSLGDLVSLSPSLTPHITVFRGPTNNLPNETVLKASKAIRTLVEGLNEDDILLTVITGGGSALLTLPKPGLELADVARTTQLLASAGCDIVELNTVRKQLDILKGGGLSKLAQPAKVVSLILSDVIGDPMDIIAAGPTVDNTTGPQDALNILAKHKVMEKVPAQVITVLKGSHDSMPACTAANFVLGSNRVALASAVTEASRQGFLPVVLTHSFSGHAEDVADQLAALAAATVLDADEETLAKAIAALCEDKRVVREMNETLRKRPSRICFLAGGEATVAVPSNCGVGGRMAHLALRAAIRLASLKDHQDRVTLLAGATDGLDGPTELAGAWVTPQTMARADQLGLNAAVHLRDCDAYGFFHKLDAGRHIRPGGITGTNVMDVVVLMIERDL